MSTIDKAETHMNEAREAVCIKARDSYDENHSECIGNPLNDFIVGFIAGYSAGVAEAEKRIRGECEWEYDDDDYSPMWNSECGTSFSFENEGPKENGFKFCHHCGRQLKLRGNK